MILITILVLVIVIIGLLSRVKELERQEDINDTLQHMCEYYKGQIATLENINNNQSKDLEELIKVSEEQNELINQYRVIREGERRYKDDLFEQCYKLGVENIDLNNKLEKYKEKTIKN